MARTLSIAPSVTKSSLLIAGAYIAFFLVAAFYPFGAGNASAIRKLIAAMLASGVLVASFGVLERAFRNGEPRLEMVRAIGPYLNPDHFANYIGMIFPLALAGVLFPWPSGNRHRSTFARIFCGGALIVIATAILQSLSRAVCLAIPVSVALFWRMVSPAFARPTSSDEAEPVTHHHSHDKRARDGRSRNSWNAIGRFASDRWFVYGVCLAVFTGALLWLAGPSARTGIDQRLGATVSGDDVSMVGRFRLWADTLRVIEGFPLFGVGLGNWAESFPHFIRPPASVMYNNHAHNDYLELAAEIGVAGIVAVSWLCWRMIATFRSGAASMGPSQWPWLAAVVSAFGVVALHELIDFNLHISANVFLLCGLAATAVRLATASNGPAVSVSKSTVYACASVGFLAAPVLAFLVATQQPLDYTDPWSLPQDRKQAVDQIVSFPADVEPHLSLARFDYPPTPQAMREFEIATWIDPHNPSVRDSYVLALAITGREKAEAGQIELSVMYAPSLDHPYFTEEWFPFLSELERKAVESGFRKAISKGYPNSIDGLAGFYALSDRHVDEAELYLKAAGQQQESYQQERFLIAAGEAFGKAGKSKEALSAFEKAANTDPSDVRPYLDLLSVVYGPAKDMESARSAVETGIGNGVDPIVLYSALAQAAQAANRPEVASAALTEIVHYAPTFENNVRLAEFYLASGKADRAVEAMRKATMIEPDSAEAYVRLAAAEEAAYLYADADRDYSHALSLEPNNPEAKSGYAEFQKRTADKGASAMSDTGK
jgi:O-antigen ligase/tetratricopeptide (TPR) repeat protein